MVDGEVYSLMFTPWDESNYFGWGV